MRQAVLIVVIAGAVLTLTAMALAAAFSQQQLSEDKLQSANGTATPTATPPALADEEFYVMTVYNPFDLGYALTPNTIYDSTARKLNNAIREVAAAHDARVADPYPLMKFNPLGWTRILAGDPHPNAEGHQVLAYSLVQARQAQVAEQP